MNTILSLRPEHSAAIPPSVSIGAPANPAARHMAWVATGGAIALAASPPWGGESSWMREFVEIACYFIFAMMWNLLPRYGGLVSTRHPALFGVGGVAVPARGAPPRPEPPF